MAWWRYTRGLFDTNDFTTTRYGGNGNDTLDNVYLNIVHIPGPGTYFEGRKGSDDINGTQHDDILVGVYPDYYNAGAGEYDRLYGGGGDDVFVLGDYYETYYQSNGYAIIEDFQQGEDKLAVNGSASDYRYYSTSVSGVGGSAQDTVLKTTDGDWVAVFQDTTFSPLYTSDFIGLG